MGDVETINTHVVVINATWGTEEILPSRTTSRSRRGFYVRKQGSVLATPLPFCLNHLCRHLLSSSRHAECYQRAKHHKENIVERRTLLYKLLKENTVVECFLDNKQENLF